MIRTIVRVAGTADAWAMKHRPERSLLALTQSLRPVWMAFMSAMPQWPDAPPLKELLQSFQVQGPRNNNSSPKPFTPREFTKQKPHTGATAEDWISQLEANSQESPQMNAVIRRFNPNIVAVCFDDLLSTAESKMAQQPSAIVNTTIRSLGATITAGGHQTICIKVNKL